jgi:murein DD-endopeptidase MepM/ murein hydrolase activator NlpD
LQFPRSHLILISVLGFGLLSFVVAKFNDDPNDDRFTTDSVLLDLPPIEQDLQVALLNVPAPEPAEAVAVQPFANWREIRATVKMGDTLSAIFKRNQLSARDVHAVSNSKPLGSRLRSIHPGHELVLFVDDASALMRLSYSTGPLETLEYDRMEDGFTGKLVNNEPERVLAYKHGTIDHSLFVSSQRAGLSDGMTMRFAQIFQWDIDFVLDIRPGDAFFVLYEDLYHNDEFIGYGDILAAEFVNQGESYRAIQYRTETGEKDFFAPSGASMRKAFLRAPVEFSRISSNFNLRRVHPLFKTVRPHRGIDYAAPSGTPILAAGDGRVVTAARTQANGNYVVIQHGEQFVTKYLHLSKFGRGIKRGVKVEQGQEIGRVGATGWATAPHLHYEFLMNDVHRNPRTVSLPDADPIKPAEMPRFKEQTNQFALLLDNYKNQVTVALAR